MKHGRQFALWTLLWLIAAGWLGWRTTRPVPEAWLRAHARSLGFVRAYARVAQPLLRWETNPFTYSNGQAMARVGLLHAPTNGQTTTSDNALHASALLTDSAMDQLRARYAPPSLERYVQRLKTVLLAPVSKRAKDAVVTDPFNLDDMLDDLVSPALTSATRTLYVFTFADSLDSAVLNAETVDRQLDDLRVMGRIGPFQGVCSFVSSPARQADRMRRFTQSLDAFEWLTTFEHALDREGIDRALLAPYLDSMRDVLYGEAEPESVDTQRTRLRAAGFLPFMRYFLDRHPEGYVSTHRVLPAPGVSLADTRGRVQSVLDAHYIDGVAFDHSVLARQYRLLLHLLLWTVGGVWAIGIAVMLLASTIKRALTRLVLREDPDTHITSFAVAPGLVAYFRSAGLASFDDFMGHGLTGPGANGDLPVTRVTQRTVDGDEFRIDRLSLPLNEHAPSFAQRDGGCTLQLVRGRGHAAGTVATHTYALRHLRAHAVLTLPVVASGDAQWHGRRHAFYAVIVRDHDIPLAAMQDAGAGLAGWWHGLHAPEALRAYGRMLRHCQRMGLYGHEPGPGQVYLRALPNGRTRVRLGGLRPASRHSLVTRVLRRLLPWLAHARFVQSITSVNRRLYPEYFSLRDRLRLYLSAVGRRRLTLFDKRVVATVMQRSLARAYVNYASRQGELCVNPSLAPRLARLGAQSYDALMALTGERTVTRKRTRTVVTLNCEGETLYLKRHTGVSLLTALLRMARGRRPLSEARQEWQAVMCLAAHGIPAVPLVAMGERFWWGFWERGSLLLSTQLPAGVSLEDELNAGPVFTAAQRQELARRVGRLARRLHMAELVHRDFYLGHIYVVGELHARYRLHLLDLQRVMPGARLYNRWALKDITSLHFSSIPVTVVSKSDRMRFLCAYLEIHTLDERARRFAVRVLRKSARVARHTEKLLVRRRRRGELPACMPPPP
jgi:hypothetical protein